MKIFAFKLLAVRVGFLFRRHYDFILGVTQPRCQGLFCSLQVHLSKRCSDVSARYTAIVEGPQRNWVGRKCLVVARDRFIEGVERDENAAREAV